jgi:pyrroloquinoline quinone biosynthesis protein B
LRGFSEGNVLYRTLQRFEGQAAWRLLELGAPERPLSLLNGAPSGLLLRAFAAPGKPALHLDQATAQAGDNFGVLIRDQRSGKSLAYISACAASSAEVVAAASAADAVFFDGTFWSSDELIALGASTRRAEDMAHWPISGPHGSLRFLAELPQARRVYIHINNTNPMLREDSSEREALNTAGIEVAFDGMELEL